MANNSNKNSDGAAPLECVRNSVSLPCRRLRRRGPRSQLGFLRRTLPKEKRDAPTDADAGESAVNAAMRHIQIQSHDKFRIL